eukprot:TRINITY_DN62277_c0_g1_i1.p1 TRINITY_DN62277_c0_g1~~TRINITY_DN62277_c0_g1_i1.p1  ORF type:complete len:321 (-),score=39.73 TRINITY_DN62277_c0_g1_i1:25-987(-)
MIGRWIFVACGTITSDCIVNIILMHRFLNSFPEKLFVQPARWRDEAFSHEKVCNMLSVSAAAMGLPDLVQELTTSDLRNEPVMLRQAAVGWAGANYWANRSAFLQKHGDLKVKLAGQVALGPESPRDAQHSLFEIAEALRDETLPQHAYSSHDSLGWTLEDDHAVIIPEMEALWKALYSAGQVNDEIGQLFPVRHVGLGGNGSGLAFHYHGFALNLVLAGRKRWLIYTDAWQVNNGINVAIADDTSLKGGMREFVEHVYPQGALRASWFDCVQEAGDVIYVPDYASHATLNEGETLAVSYRMAQTMAKLTLDEQGNLIKA